MKLSSLCALLLPAAGALAQTNQPSLPLTRTFDPPKDWREQQRQQIIRYYERRVAAAGAIRDRKWQPDFSSEEANRKSVQPHRAPLRAMPGLRGYEPGKAEARKLAPGVEEVRFALNGGCPVRALIFAPTQPSGAAVIAIPPETYTVEAFAHTRWVPARLINAMSFDPAPSKNGVLARLARRNYGPQGARAVLKAWDHFSDGIRLFPYPDNVFRIPEPLQKSPRHPFLLDPKIGGFGSWRSWRNDLNWTKSWEPRVTSTYLCMVKAAYTKGIASLEEVRRSSVEPYRETISAEWRRARTIEASLDTVLNLLDWIETRDRFYRARDAEARAAEARSLEKILFTKRANALKIFLVLDQDSRLGYTSEGGGVVRGGLFTPELVRWKIGKIHDVLTRELPALTGRAPAAVPLRCEGSQRQEVQDEDWIRRAGRDGSTHGSQRPQSRA